jgi:hypothetical protein
MATIDTRGFPAGIQSLVRSVVWQLFNATKDQSLRFKLGPIPISVKIEKLRPLVEHWVGPESAASEPVGVAPTPL